MKVIAIIDAPNMCFECPLRNGDECNLIGDIEGEADYVDERCPLKPMPRREQGRHFFNELGENTYVCGWNACIDEILGETE